MVEMWYYTCEGKQMEPISIRDLKRLVGDGVLKPTDMVWKEGLPRWIRASTLKDLFPDPSSSLDQYFASSTAAPVDAARSDPAAKVSVPAANAGSRPRLTEEDEPRPQRRRRPAEDDDDRGRPRRRGPASNGGGYGTQILIACAVGVVFLVASFVIGILIYAMPQKQQRGNIDLAAPVEKKDVQPVAPPPPPAKGGNPAPPVLPDAKTGNGILPITVNLGPGAEHILKFRVKANHAATITVTPQPVPGRIVNLDLQVFKDSDNALIVADEKPSPGARVEFTVPATEIVRVRIHNASKKTTVTQFTLFFDVGN